MTILFTSGAFTTTDDEQTLFDVTADEHIACWLFTHNMQSGDQMRVKIYELDDNGDTTRTYFTHTLIDAQAKPAFYIPFLPSRQFKITLERMAGTDRKYNWTRAEVV